MSFGFCGKCKKDHRSIWGRCSHCGILLCPQCYKGLVCPVCSKMKVEKV